MTYRNKILLKRIAIAAGILVVIVILALVIGFSYLGRYVVYTQDGAYFEFNAADHIEEDEGLNILPPDSAVLVMGESIYEPDALVDESIIRLADDEVNGLLVDYDTLKNGSTLNAIELTENSYNMLVLEMRSGGSEILQTEPVMTLIERAKNQNIKLVAMMSCLDDRTYALAHGSEALPIEGGALWVSSSGSYWLNPEKDTVINYIADMIFQLSDMGFQEVILNNFYFPESTYIVYSNAEKTRAEVLQDAYEKLEEIIGLRCTLGLYVQDPASGHQAYDYAEHLYVYYSSGGELEYYKNTHPDYYIVFVSESRDTRFDSFGKLMIENDESELIPEATQTTTEETPTE